MKHPVPNLFAYDLDFYPIAKEIKSENLSPNMTTESQTFVRNIILLLSLCNEIFTEKNVTNEFCHTRFNQKLELLKLVDVQLNYLWSQVDVEISQAEKAVLAAKAKVNRDNAAFVGFDVIGNILKIAGRVSFLWKMMFQVKWINAFSDVY